MKMVIFGAGGSVGRQAVDVISEIKTYKVLAISLDLSYIVNKEIIKKTMPEVALYQDNTPKLQTLIKEFPKVRFLSFNKHYQDVLRKYPNAHFFNALPGVYGLMPLVLALKLGYQKIFLANKESLVMAGSIIKKLQTENKVEIIPIDSEHYALLKLYNEIKSPISKLLITASGGAIRDIPLSKIKSLKKENILTHPIWNMGPEITVNSATMVNKVYEVIEASFYFNKEIDKIKVLISPEGLVHAGIILEDGRMILNLSKPSMTHPIKLALTDENIKDLSYVPDLTKLTFKEVNNKRYPLFSLGLRSIKNNDLLSVLFCVANSFLVNLFLEDKIFFGDISKNLIKILKDRDKYLKNYTYNLESVIKLSKNLPEILSNEYCK